MKYRTLKNKALLLTCIIFFAQNLQAEITGTVETEITENVEAIETTEMEEAEDTATRELFSKYIDSSYKNYDFAVENLPLFFQYPSLYFPDINVIKGKIVKKTVENYYRGKYGIKYVSDGTRMFPVYTYYQFDNNGRMKKQFGLELCISGTKVEQIQDQNYSEYSIAPSKCILKFKSFKYDEEGEDIYNIEEVDNKLLIRVNQIPDPWVIEKGKITDLRTQRQYSDDCLVYQLYNSDGVLEKERTYKQGALMKHWELCKNGIEVFYTYSTTEGKGAVTRQTSYNNDSEERCLERRFNPAGFMEYEIMKPDANDEYAEGDYDITTVEILDKPDELLKTYFYEYLEITEEDENVSIIEEDKPLEPEYDLEVEITGLTSFCKPMLGGMPSTIKVDMARQTTIVKHGDSLEKLVADYNKRNKTNMTVQEVARINGIINTTSITVGQEILFSKKQSTIIVPLKKQE